MEHDVKKYSEDLKTSNTEIKELKITFQKLQIDLESHLSMVREDKLHTLHILLTVPKCFPRFVLDKRFTVSLKCNRSVCYSSQ